MSPEPQSKKCAPQAGVARMAVATAPRALYSPAHAGTGRSGVLSQAMAAWIQTTNPGRRASPRRPDFSRGRHRGAAAGVDGNGPAQFRGARQANVFPLFRQRLARSASGYDRPAAPRAARRRGGPARPPAAASTAPMPGLQRPAPIWPRAVPSRSHAAAVADEPAAVHLVKSIYSRRDGAVPPAARAFAAQGGVAEAGRLPGRRQLDGR